MTDPRDVEDQRRAREYRRMLDASLGGNPAEVQRLEELDRINRSRSNAIPVGDAGSHWIGCERVHPACREALTRGRRCGT